MMQVKWTQAAAKALEYIQDDIAKENAGAAFEVGKRIRLALTQVEAYPKAGRKGRILNTYELVIPGLPYIVVYRIQKKEIQILSVYHTSRTWPDIFD